MAEKPDPVVLHAAYSWECPTCGRHQFGAMVTAEITDEGREEAVRISLGLDPWQEIPEGVGGEFVMMPEAVTCEGCGGAFPVFSEE